MGQGGGTEGGNSSHTKGRKEGGPAAPGQGGGGLHHARTDRASGRRADGLREVALLILCARIRPPPYAPQATGRGQVLSHGPVSRKP